MAEDAQSSMVRGGEGGGGDEVATHGGTKLKMTILVALVGFAVGLLIALLWVRWRRETREGGKKDEEVKEARSKLEEISQREKEKRRQLEKELEALQELKRRKAVEIENLSKIREEEELRVRERQEEAKLISDRRREEEREKIAREKEEIKKAFEKGILCMFKDIKDEHADVTLRIPMVDSVGNATTVEHMKSRIKAVWDGNPSEERQRIVLNGRLLDGSVKLRDLYQEHAKKSEPLAFHVIVALPQPKRRTREVERRQEEEEDKKKMREEEKEEVRSSVGAEDVQAAKEQLPIDWLATQDDLLTINIKIQSLNKNVKLSSSRQANILAVKEMLISKECPELTTHHVKVVHCGKILSDSIVIEEILEKSLVQNDLTLYCVVSKPQTQKLKASSAEVNDTYGIQREAIREAYSERMEMGDQRKERAKDRKGSDIQTKDKTVPQDLQEENTSPEQENHNTSHVTIQRAATGQKQEQVTENDEDVCADTPTHGNVQTQPIARDHLEMSDSHHSSDTPSISPAQQIASLPAQRLQHDITFKILQTDVCFVCHFDGNDSIAQVKSHVLELYPELSSNNLFHLVFSGKVLTEDQDVSSIIAQRHDAVVYIVKKKAISASQPPISSSAVAGSEVSTFPNLPTIPADPCGNAEEQEAGPEGQVHRQEQT
eukprot:752274-Hanusia_phi.AAC.1